MEDIQHLIVYIGQSSAGPVALVATSIFQVTFMTEILVVEMVLMLESLKMVLKFMNT